jgi:hypothetical protein
VYNRKYAVILLDIYFDKILSETMGFLFIFETFTVYIYPYAMKGNNPRYIHKYLV